MPSFNYDNIQFHYEDDGGAGDPFIFLHGLGGDTNQTFGLMKPTDHIRRISVDFRGHGKTVSFGETADFSFRQFADDVMALTEHLGITHFNLGDIAKKHYENSDIYKTMNALSSYAGEALMGQFNYPYVKETSIKFVKLPMDCPNSNREEWTSLIHSTLILACKQDPIHPFPYGLLLHEYIPNSRFMEVTSKTISNKQHSAESYEAIKNFLHEQ